MVWSDALHKNAGDRVQRFGRMCRNTMDIIRYIDAWLESDLVDSANPAGVLPDVQASGLTGLKNGRRPVLFKVRIICILPCLTFSSLPCPKWRWGRIASMPALYRQRHTRIHHEYERVHINSPVFPSHESLWINQTAKSIDSCIGIAAIYHAWNKIPPQKLLHRPRHTER